MSRTCLWPPTPLEMAAADRGIRPASGVCLFCVRMWACMLPHVCACSRELAGRGGQCIVGVWSEGRTGGGVAREALLCRVCGQCTIRLRGDGARDGATDGSGGATLSLASARSAVHVEGGVGMRKHVS